MREKARTLVIAPIYIVACTSGSLSPYQICPTKQYHYQFLIDNNEMVNASSDDPDDVNLRDRILKSFDTIVKSGKFRPGVYGNDITDSVRRYIYPGMSFQEATDKLRDAGFKIESYPSASSSHNLNRPKDWYAVLAKMTVQPLGRAGVAVFYVTILPKSPGEYTVLEEVSASVFTPAL